MIAGHSVLVSGIASLVDRSKHCSASAYLERPLSSAIRLGLREQVSVNDRAHGDYDACSISTILTLSESSYSKWNDM